MVTQWIRRCSVILRSYKIKLPFFATYLTISKVALVTYSLCHCVTSFETGINCRAAIDNTWVFKFREKFLIFLTFWTSKNLSFPIFEEAAKQFFNTFPKGIRRSLTSEDDSLDEYNHIDYLPTKTKHTKQRKTSTPPPTYDDFENARNYDNEQLDQSAVLDNKQDEPIYIKGWVKTLISAWWCLIAICLVTWKNASQTINKHVPSNYDQQKRSSGRRKRRRRKENHSSIRPQYSQANFGPYGSRFTSANSSTRIRQGTGWLDS